MKRIAQIFGLLAAILVVAFLFLRTPDTDPREMRVKYGAPPSQFVTLANGQEIHLRDEGPRNAPAIILLHGSNADLHTWQLWVEGLRDDYRVVRFDQIGHGLTGAAVDGQYGPDRYVESVHLVADRLGLSRFVLGGNSMGGGIAINYAMRHPEQLAGLVLVDAGGADVPREGGGNLAFTLARMPGVGQAMSQMLPRSLVARSLSQSVSNQDVVTGAAVDRYWQLARYPGNRAATRARFAQDYRPFDAGRIAKVEVPTLILWGEEDALTPVGGAQWYARHLPAARLVTYPGIGHLPMEEAADESLRDLREWLAQTLSPTPPQEDAG